MLFQITIVIAGIVTLCALVWLFPCVNERMSLQSGTPVERFIAPLTNIFFYSSMDSLVTIKVRPASKRLWAQVTGYLFDHFQITAPLCPDSLQLLIKVAETQFITADHFPKIENIGIDQVFT